jgi:hypothetical protein
MTSPLTFGVEFEFSVAAIRPNHVDPRPSHPGRIDFPISENTLTPHVDLRATIHRAIYAALRAAGLPLERDPGPDYFSYTRWSITDDLTILIPPKSAPCDSPNYDWHSAEVISPAMYFCPAALSQLRVACAVISSLFRVVATSSTGLHVHVGDGANGFNHNTLRNLVSLLWAFEPQLMTLHPPHRHNDDWCQTLHKDSRYAWRHPGRTVYKALGDFFSPTLETIDDLLKQFKVAGGGQLAVNFSNLTDPMIGEKQTIEFRMHAGTLEGDEVVMWVRTVVGLVQWARDVDTDVFMSVMSCAEVGIDEFGVVSLLEMLGLREEAAYYRGRLHPLGVDAKDAVKVYESQDLARPRMDVLQDFGIGEDGVATRNNWNENLIFDAFN